MRSYQNRFSSLIYGSHINPNPPPLHYVLISVAVFDYLCRTYPNQSRALSRLCCKPQFPPKKTGWLFCHKDCSSYRDLYSQVQSTRLLEIMRNLARSYIFCTWQSLLFQLSGQPKINKSSYSTLLIQRFIEAISIEILSLFIKLPLSILYICVIN